MVFVTGDCNGNFDRIFSFCRRVKTTARDYVIVAGDFGLWHDSFAEREMFDKMEKKVKSKILFVDGNHENFERLMGDEFKTIRFHGGVAKKIRKNVFYLMRGNVYKIAGKKFFCFGGATSHDTEDGILDPDNFDDAMDLVREVREWNEAGKRFRIKGISWWPQEMPTRKEMALGISNLKKNDFRVDYIISHCCPSYVQKMMFRNFKDTDRLTDYFDTISKSVEFDKWLFGHYHKEQTDGKYEALYKRFVRVI